MATHRQPANTSTTAPEQAQSRPAAPSSEAGNEAGASRKIDPRTLEPLPIAERVGGDDRYTGRGVVAAFLDSGFYAHPDLHSRVLEYQDLIGNRSGVELLGVAEASSWHGMMSTVVAAGNGSLSKGRFRALAPDLKLVLVKVGTLSRVHHDDIARGIEWVLVNRERLNIRVLNISCGGDYERSYLDDVMSRFTEAAVRAGITVVCAVGNSGYRPGHIMPPASVPAVISVGGIDDAGNPSLRPPTGYRSSYGPTIDGLQKPEVVTLADWIAAPILPGTPTALQASLLSQLHNAEDKELRPIIEQNLGVYPALDEARAQPAYLIRHVIASGLRDGLVIDEHYKMVDGTSFAAPIVTSLVAQMLEANPKLTPQQLKMILIKTAKRLPNLEIDRQGWGAIQAKAAVAQALAMI